MEPSNIISSGGALCSLGQSLFGSIYAILWSIVTYLGFWKCLLIFLSIIIWVAWEIIKKGTHSYNSENGLTPTFNTFIGASTYFWLQTLIYFIFQKFFSEAIYCLKWPYILHIFIFLVTGFALHITGIWSYWKIFGKKIRL